MNVVKIDRREFMKIAGAGSAGLVLALQLPHVARAFESDGGVAAQASPLATYVEIGTNGDVTIYVPHSEMGQGVRTSLPMIVAEELDADWNRVKIRQADLDARFGSQGTGGSGSVQGRWKELRSAGAAARAMLVAAAASRWGVDPATITVSNGVISHGEQRLTFGEVAEEASKLPVPKDVTLKDPSKFTLIGTKVRRPDDPAIVTGKAQYGIDVRVPGMLYAVVARSPVFGGKPVSWDAEKAKAIAGVRQVVTIDETKTDLPLPWRGVAVIADSTWAAMKGRDALAVKWDEGPHATESSEAIRAAMTEGLAKSDPVRFLDRGNVDAALAASAKKVEAVYEVPFLAHATMEPQNATVSATADGAEVWAPTQFPESALRVVAHALNLKPEQVKVHVTLLGGGFGRRINSDYVLEAALLSKAAGAPVHVQWTREDDMTHDYYRPPSMHKLTGSVDADGKITAYVHRMALPSVRSYYSGPKAKDLQEARGLDEFFEMIPSSRGEFVLVDSAVPRGWWRAVGAVANGFVIQSFLDELAHAAGKDPIDFQLALIGKGFVMPNNDEKDYPFNGDRARAVIELVRDKSGWGKPLPAGRGRGFAWMFDALTPCAEVAEVSVAKNGSVRVHRVTAAIDCGIAVNPDGVAAQVEGGIMFGLTAALKGAITVDKGRVQQSNFHDYELLRIGDMPAVDVHIVPSRNLPTGTGEPPVPPIAPAVANAIFAATGKRVRRLPMVVPA